MEQVDTIELDRTAENRRKYDDLTTWASEVLNGNMRTSFEFVFDGDELLGHDGLPLGPVFKNAIVDAEKVAIKNPNLNFEVRRRKTEEAEYGNMLAMAKGDSQNTMVVVSDFVPELMDATEDIGGYNVSRKQTMLRVIYRKPDGKICMVSQSLEGSYRGALEAIYGDLGFEAADGELLGQRMQLDMEPEEQEFLVDQLAGVYDRALADEYGGTWRAGWHIPDERAFVNTYDFVLDQQDLIQAFFDNRVDLSNEALYGFAAAIYQRFEQSISTDKSVHISSESYANPAQEMQFAAIYAYQQGRVFSGCGISSNGGVSTADKLGILGFGNQTSEITSYKFDTKMYCLLCQSPPKDDEEEKMCGPCGLCLSCDVKLSYKND